MRRVDAGDAPGRTPVELTTHAGRLALLAGIAVLLTVARPRPEAQSRLGFALPSSATTVSPVPTPPPSPRSSRRGRPISSSPPGTTTTITGRPRRSMRTSGSTITPTSAHIAAATGRGPRPIASSPSWAITTGRPPGPSRTSTTSPCPATSATTTWCGAPSTSSCSTATGRSPTESRSTPCRRPGCAGPGRVVFALEARGPAPSPVFVGVAWFHPALQWPFEAWGAHAVLAGHDHLYERVTFGNFPYFVNGLGGPAAPPSSGWSRGARCATQRTTAPCWWRPATRRSHSASSPRGESWSTPIPCMPRPRRTCRPRRFISCPTLMATARPTSSGGTPRAPSLSGS